jgi:hypothetical protein
MNQPLFKILNTKTTYCVPLLGFFLWNPCRRRSGPLGTPDTWNIREEGLYQTTAILYTLIKKKSNFSSYIRKFRMEHCKVVV